MALLQIGLLLAAQTPTKESCQSSAAVPTVRSFLTAINNKDRDTIMGMALPQGRATMIGLDSPEIRSWEWFGFIGALPAADLSTKESVGRPFVTGDQHLAFVATEYRFQMNDGYRGTGAYHFDLVCVKRNWKVLNMTYTIRTKWP